MDIILIGGGFHSQASRERERKGVCTFSVSMKILHVVISSLMQNHKITMADNTEELHRRIKELENEVAYLNDQLKQDDRFGLKWIDVPEAFDKESENKIPILEEVPELAITNDDGKPTHILIEGDNYHALTCHNYTHHGKVDVIYIDPPYNTGSDGFTYKDKRFLDKYPDGAKLPANHPLRHSSWLSFMKKRLELAFDLLSDEGVIYISIDDHEFANIKCLCDCIFGYDKFISVFPRLATKSGKTPQTFMVSHDYVICYVKNKKDIFVGMPFEDSSYKYSDEFENTRGKYNIKQPLDCNSISYSASLDYPIEYEGKTYYPGGDYDKYIERKSGKHLKKDYAWRWSKELYDFGLENGWIVFKNGRIYTKGYLNAILEKQANGKYGITYRNKTRKLSTIDFVENNFSNDIAKKELAAFNLTKRFDYPKPTSLIKDLIESHYNKNAVCLDFFAGSGSTGESVMQLNNKDKGHRKFILVQVADEDICKEVTYKRNVKIVEGYNDNAPLGNSLKYYRTSFVGSNTSNQATDKDKTLLAQKAGCLLALAENTLYEQKKTDNYQIFKDKDREVWTAIYFKEDYRHKFFSPFVEEVSKLNGKKNVYIFSWGDVGSFESYFDGISGIDIKGIPQPILDIYKSLNS